MSLDATSVCVTQKRTLSCLLAGRAGKRPKHEDAQQLQEAAVQLLNRHQNLSDLLLEVGSPNPCNGICHEKSGRKEAASESPTPAIGGSLLVSELRRQAGELGVPVAALSVRMVLERVLELTNSRPEGDREGGVLLNATNRVQLSVLLQSTRELLSLGAFCSKLLWHEYWKEQKQPKLEVVHHLHSQNILTLEYMLESEEGVRPWLVSELKALCGWTASEQEEEGREVRQQVLSTVVTVLVRVGFEETQDSAAAAAPSRRRSQVCCSMLDDMLSWVLDILDTKQTLQFGESAAELWVQMFDASLCGVSVSPDALRRFFTHSLTHTLTYRPRLKVSDAIAMQNEWSFAKTCRLLTSLFQKLAVIFNVKELLSHLQQVLETHEVNWQHVLSCLSTLLVYNPYTQPSLRELLSRLLCSAFESYDLENMITAFLLARQGAVEGPGIFPSYSEWFKMSFGSTSSYHGNSKKSLVFLLKFLSDLVPFDPPQYLKVHILHPPYVAVKHRALLQEYVTLAKTRLADLKLSVEDMGLYEDVSGAAGASVQPQCQARQDVEKALSLFESTGRISATVMEASIFRRPYFLTRFLHALLAPRVLPVKADTTMSFIESLRKAGKIPAAQYSSYVEACQRERQRHKDGGTDMCVENDDNPQQVLQAQLQEFRGLLKEGNDGEVSAQLARISHTLSVIFPDRAAKELIGQTVFKLHIDTPPSPEQHIKVVNLILRSFCQSLLDASRINPPNKQSLWASQFVNILLGHTQLLSALLHRLWDLLHNQGASLSAAHVLGLAVFVVHLHSSMPQCPLVQLCPPLLPSPVPITQALSAALSCSTNINMLFCVRFCVAAVCYGLCKGDSQLEQLQLQQQQFIPSSLCRKLLYLIPRLMPDVRRSPIEVNGESVSVGPDGTGQEEESTGLWKSVTDTNMTWKKTAWVLWNHDPFRLLLQLPEYQFSFSEWLAAELRVQRNEDALSDPDRQEYQQWACQQLYLPCPVDQGGCGGDIRTACSHILNAIMDQQTGSQTQENPDHRSSEAGTCLPDLLSRLQEMVYEMELTRYCHSAKDDKSHYLLELISNRCSVTSDPEGISSELSLQQTLQTWNRVLLALPAVMLLKVKTDGGRRTLDCHTLMEHINQYQRKVCYPPGLLPYQLTVHFLKGILSASVSCDSPSKEVNKAMSLTGLHCPLLLVSAGHWWGCLSPVLVSLWHRLSDGEPLPKQLQVLADCHLWACSSEKGVSNPVPSAPPLLLAACLHSAWTGRERRQGRGQGISPSLETVGQLTKHRQLLVFLLFMCVMDLLAGFLTPQGVKSLQRARELCTDFLLTLLVDSADWLLLFKSPASEEQGQYQSVTMVASDDYMRLMPLAFYSLVPHLKPEVLERTVRAPGFLYTAIHCYSSVIKLFLDGQTPDPGPGADTSADQLDLSQILTRAQQLLLKTISLTPPTSLSSSKVSQLEALCADLDPEVAAALSSHLSPSSPDIDFL